MPVTIRPSPQLVGRNRDTTVHSAAGLLQATAQASSHPAYKNQTILRSSFDDLDSDSPIIPYRNGLVDGIIRAFQQDLHLALRPDDVWLSILTQFNTFVNANADDLRAHFVAHDGQMDLMIDVSPHSVWKMDTGKFAQEMTLLIQENVVDVNLRDWIIPNFSTTTDNDKSVAAIVMMGTLQRYFHYVIRGGCGFPSVTLLGERSDWESILHKIQKLPKYGNATTEWCQLLTPVIKHMLESFDEPNSQQIKDFWLRACHSGGEAGYSDIQTLSGWVTAFCFWSDDGSRTLRYSHEKLSKYPTPVVDRKPLILDGIAYPIISSSYGIPKGVVSVPVLVQDKHTGVQHATELVAGSVGMTATATGSGKDLTTVQPRSGWWMLEKSSKPFFVNIKPDIKQLKLTP